MEEDNIRECNFSGDIFLKKTSLKSIFKFVLRIIILPPQTTGTIVQLFEVAKMAN